MATSMLLHCGSVAESHLMHTAIGYKTLLNKTCADAQRSQCNVSACMWHGGLFQGTQKLLEACVNASLRHSLPCLEAMQRILITFCKAKRCATGERVTSGVRRDLHAFAEQEACAEHGSIHDTMQIIPAFGSTGLHCFSQQTQRCSWGPQEVLPQLDAWLFSVH